MTRAARGLVAALALCAAPAIASTFLDLPVSELASRADRGIVAGRVLSLASAWNEPRTMIWTEAEVLVTEDLAGGDLAGRTLTFRVPGGTVEGVEIAMEGAPVFHPGEEVVAFATTWPDGSLKVLGYFQGLSRLSASTEDGAPRLVGGSADGMTLEGVRSAAHAAARESR